MSPPRAFLFPRGTTSRSVLLMVPIISRQYVAKNRFRKTRYELDSGAMISSLVSKAAILLVMVSISVLWFVDLASTPDIWHKLIGRDPRIHPGWRLSHLLLVLADTTLPNYLDDLPVWNGLEKNSFNGDWGCGRIWPSAFVRMLVDESLELCSRNHFLSPRPPRCCCYWLYQLVLDSRSTELTFVAALLPVQPLGSLQKEDRLASSMHMTFFLICQHFRADDFFDKDFIFWALGRNSSSIHLEGDPVIKRLLVSQKLLLRDVFKADIVWITALSLTTEWH